MVFPTVEKCFLSFVNLISSNNHGGTILKSSNELTSSEIPITGLSAKDTFKFIKTSFDSMWCNNC